MSLELLVNNQFSAECASQALREGQLIAYPTEAVYGLGCDPLNKDAVQSLLRLKSRDESKGLILIASKLIHIEPFVDVRLVPMLHFNEALKTWPGPATWLFPATNEVPTWIKGENQNVAVRISAHPIVQQLCEAFGGAIVSTSANIAGQEPLKSAHEVSQTFCSTIAGVVDGKLGGEAKPTPIKDIASLKTIRSA